VHNPGDTGAIDHYLQHGTLFAILGNDYN